MRDIKFRAWSERMGMRQLDQITMGDKVWSCENGNGVSLIYQPHIVVMQFTGLQDKNGKDVYDGDRISFHYWSTYEQRSFPEYVDFKEHDVHKGTGIVYWNEQELQWYVKPDEKYKTLWGDGFNSTMEDSALMWVGVVTDVYISKYNEEREESEKITFEQIAGIEVVGNIHENPEPLKS